MPDLGETKERVPAHLRRFVVQQDYAAYTVVDHAVWRFVLLQLYNRLEREAHPAYARGLAQTGMSIDRIPRIDEMDACLRQFGWGAICVDGFIPPRAFQEFQSLGILPIAAAMRTVEHLAYTPAPDVIHEAAGHAPILPDPEYAAFLRRIGECGVRAFASRRDSELYAAIYRLSVVKEQRDASAESVAEAERTLAELVARPALPSEAARLARFYWWTVEYGLIGNEREYKLYGAGLLSSLAESHFCHYPDVRKLALSRECVEVDYDITQPQPQLFVARDFAQLNEVLDDVCSGMAFQQGGLFGLRVAREADEVATLELDRGWQWTGTVADLIAREQSMQLVALRGECALAVQGRMLEGHTREHYRHGVVLVFGPAADGTELTQLTREELVDRYPGSAPGGVRVPLPGGFTLEGSIEAGLTHTQVGAARRVSVLRGGRVLRGDHTQWSDPSAQIALVGKATVTSVRAGAADSGYWPAAEYSRLSSPAHAPENPRQHARRTLYERAWRAVMQGAPGLERELGSVHAVLQRDHEDDWLLRWNLLESLQRLDLDPARRAMLVAELWRLEYALHERYPIATGLRYLGHVDPARASSRPSRPPR